MKIKYIKAKCFLSVGTAPIEVDFEKLGNIINIRGHNYDRRQGSSNGAGKSTLLEIIVYALYGRLLKKMNHKEAINTKVKKGCEVQIKFDLNGHEYHITRLRKPDGLTLFKDSVNVSVGDSIPKTQEEIERVIGLTYEAFVNIAFFGQHNKYSFLSCEAAKKREIVENLLALEKYNAYCTTTKKKKKDLEDKIKIDIKDYENAYKQVEMCEKRLLQLQQQQQQWHLMRQNELESLQRTLASKEAQMKTTDHGKLLVEYQEAQEGIAKIKEDIAARLNLQEEIKKKLLEYGEKLATKKAEKHEFDLKLATISSNNQAATIAIVKAKKALEPLDQLKDGELCPLCQGVAGKDNYHNIIDHHQKIIDQNEKEIAQNKEEKENLTASRDKVNEGILKIEAAIKQCQDKLQTLSRQVLKQETKMKSLQAIKEPKVGLQETLLRQEYEHVEKMIVAKKEEIAAGDPYQEMFVATEQELETHRKTAGDIKNVIKDKEGRLPYYDYWIKGFGDKGIRSLVMDSIIPALNTRINYWLQFLIDNQIKLTFNSDLEETIESNPPDGDPFVYNGLSGGEHLRIDLAISQAFAYLMMLSSGTCPSIVALDEVVTYQDRPGVHCIYSMICELARDRQVIIISHDQDLLQMLDSCDTITVEKRNGFSTASVVSIK